MIQFWAPEIDSAHPLQHSRAQRDVLQCLSDSSDVSIRPVDQGLGDVSDPASAYLFHTHEAAMCVGGDRNRLGGDGFDVVKVEWRVSLY